MVLLLHRASFALLMAMMILVIKRLGYRVLLIIFTPISFPDFIKYNLCVINI